MTDIEEFDGAKLRQVRQAKRLTVKQLAELVDRQPAYLNQLERGERKPSLTTLVRLEEALGVPAHELGAVGFPEPERNGS